MNNPHLAGWALRQPQLCKHQLDLPSWVVTLLLSGPFGQQRLTQQAAKAGLKQFAADSVLGKKTEDIKDL